MADFDTEFLAEEWLTFLKEKVEPEISGVTFSSYIPKRENRYIKASPRVRITFTEKELFYYKLKGASFEHYRVEESLARYVLKKHGKRMPLMFF